MEATGLYWLALFSFLDEADYFIHVIKPIQTDGWRKGTEIRKRKTVIIIPQFIIYNVAQTSINQVFINKKVRSEEHTSELQSRFDLVCRLLLEKKKHTARASRRPSDVLSGIVVV